MKVAVNGFRLMICACAVAVLAGCAFGQKISYSSTSADIGASGTATVALAVWDQRPYVVSGDKGPEFVGLMRSGFGIPYNVKTASGGPLANDFADVMRASLNARGFTASIVPTQASQSRHVVDDALHAADTQRAVLVKLNEWKSNTYVHTRLLYNVDVIVYGTDGSESANRNFSGDAPTGNVVVSLRHAIEEWFSDPKIVAALK